MDPKEVLKNLLNACADEDKEAAMEAVEALKGWFECAGFCPRVIKSDGFARDTEKGASYFIPKYDNY